MVLRLKGVQDLKESKQVVAQDSLQRKYFDIIE